MRKITGTYSAYCLNEEIGKIIGAPHSLCAKDYKEDSHTLPMGKYIWNSNYTRAHFRKDLDMDTMPDRVLAEFSCDNRFILYINGKIAYDSKDYFDVGKKVNTGVLDVTEYFEKGKNRIAVTAYQTGTFDRFLSALRGCFEVTRGDIKEYIKTDRTFEYVHVCGYWEDKEKDGWQTSDDITRHCTDEYEAHPSTLRRSVYIRKNFDVKKADIQSAVLRATAFGMYVPYINGNAVTDERFLPGAMDGAKEYREFDITDKLCDGENVVGAILGNGWYNCTAYGILFMRPLALAAEIILTYKNGNREAIPTDESWLCNNSPIYEDDIQFGERYDARRRIDNWCSTLCDTSEWVNAEIKDISHKPYTLQSYPSVRVTQTLQHIKKWDIGENRIIYDFGSNNAARCRFTVKGAKSGDKFRIRYAERIPEGEPHLGVYGDVFYISDTFKDGSARGALRNCDLYICRGEDVEVYEPMFAYTGFRYIYIEYPEGFDTENMDVEARLIHNDLEIYGKVRTSYTPLANIWEMICRTFMSNIVGGPTDCPTREKNFWNGDIQIFCYTAMWMCDVNDILSRWTHLGRKIGYNVYGWEDEEYVLPYKLYKFYGNIDILKAKYDTILALIEKREKNYETSGGFPKGSARYRDHLSIVNVSHDFFAFCWHAYMYKQAAQISEILGKTDKATEFYAKWEMWKKRFSETYYLAKEKDYSEHCQGGIILPVMLGLADEAEIPALVDTLVKYIERDNGPTTGFFTTERLLMVLSSNGHRELAHSIMTRDTFPSWLHLWKTGSTTITESWHGEKGSYGASMNHYAFGSVGRYFFESLGGLKDHSGDMTHFEICPEICENIGDFGVSYKTPYGEISSFWKVCDGKGTLEVSVPCGVTARVTVPDGRVVEDVRGDVVFEF